MQSSLVHRRAATRPVDGRRALVAKPTGRLQSLQVFAKKGKGKGIIRQSAGVSGLAGNTGPAGQQMAQMVDAKVPEVDPEQIEFVLFVKGEKVPVGKLISDTPWMPLSIMRGGPAGTTLGKLMETTFGRKLYSNLLIRQIGQSLYKDKESIANGIRKGYPPLAQASTKQFKFAFKIRDKSNPAAWKDPEGLTILPPESEVQGTGFDNVKAFFSAENVSKLFSNN